MNLLHQSAETLAGRIAYEELTPLTVAEVVHSGPNAANRLWVRGGFPDSFLAASDEKSFRWRAAFIQTYLERDVPVLGPRIPAETLRRYPRRILRRFMPPAAPPAPHPQPSWPFRSSTTSASADASPWPTWSAPSGCSEKFVLSGTAAFRRTYGAVDGQSHSMSVLPIAAIRHSQCKDE